MLMDGGLSRNYPGAAAWLDHRLQEVINGGSRAPQCWIAGDDASPAGVLILTPKKLALKLSTLYVAEQFRGRGLGTQLMDRAIDSSRSLGFDEIYVTVAEHSVSLLRPLLYSKGFICSAIEQNRYGLGRHEAIFTKVGFDD